MDIEITSRNPRIPYLCCCCACNATNTRSTSKSQYGGILPTETVSFDFPYCSRCARHARIQGIAFHVGIVDVCATVLACSMWGLQGIWVALVCTAVYVALTMYASRQKSPTCSTHGDGVEVTDMLRDKYALHFYSAEYAELFLRANPINAKEI